MRLTTLIATICFVAGIALYGADKDLAEFKPLMKRAASASGGLKSALKKEDSAAAQTSARELSEGMARIGEFWSRRNAEDAVEFAKNLEKAADNIAAKAGANEFAAATTLLDSSLENCAGCHKAHRKMGLGGFKLK